MLFHQFFSNLCCNLDLGLDYGVTTMAKEYDILFQKNCGESAVTSCVWLDVHSKSQMALLSLFHSHMSVVYSDAA